MFILISSAPPYNYIQSSYLLLPGINFCFQMSDISVCLLQSLSFSACFSFVHYFLIFLAYSSLKQPSVVECSLSNPDTSEKKEAGSLHSPCDTQSGPPEDLNKIMTLEVLTLALPPQRLSDAETPLWKVLEGGSCKDTTVQISAEEGAKPLCRG